MLGTNPSSVHNLILSFKGDPLGIKHLVQATIMIFFSFWTHYFSLCILFIRWMAVARKIYKRTITFSFDWPVYNKPISQTFCSRKRCIQNIHGLKNIHVMCSYWVWRQHVVVVWNTIQHPKSNFLTFHKPILVKLFWWLPFDFNLEIYVQQNLYLWCSASQHACLLTQWASVWILSEVEILN